MRLYRIYLCLTLLLASPAAAVWPQRAPLSAAGEAQRRLLTHGKALLRSNDSPRQAAPYSALPRALAQNEPNTLVNNPDLDSGESRTQSEVTLAANGSKLCAAYNDSGGPSVHVGFSRSADNGLSWSDLGPSRRAYGSDPTLALHRRSSTFYLGGLGFVGDGSPIGSAASVVVVSRSVDDCRSFEPPTVTTSSNAPASVCVAPAEHACGTIRCRVNGDCDSQFGANDGLCVSPDFDDKPWITVDNSGGAYDGTVYACWSRFANEVGDGAQTVVLHVSRSVDRGATWMDDQALTEADGFAQGCFMTVGPGGEVYVSWTSFAEHPDIMLRRSLDGGQTWEPARQVNDRAIRYPGGDRFAVCGQDECSGEDAPRPTLNGDVRMTAQTWLAVDSSGGAYNGNLYIAWVDDPLGDVDNADVYVARSTDAGLTWSAAHQLSGVPGTDQFEPFLAVAANGTVAVAWYDRRNDVAHNFLLDVYGTFSTDGGEHFRPPLRLTDQSFPVPPITGQPTGNADPMVASCYMGEYLAVTAGADRFYYAWGDNRSTITTAAYPQGRPDPDVRFTSRSAQPAPLCLGNCNGDSEVTVDEILLMVNIALETGQLVFCEAADADLDGTVTIDEILQAVRNALNGCA